MAEWLVETTNWLEPAKQSIRHAPIYNWPLIESDSDLGQYSPRRVEFIGDQPHIIYVEEIRTQLIPIHEDMVE